MLFLILMNWSLGGLNWGWKVAISTKYNKWKFWWKHCDKMEKTRKKCFLNYQNWNGREFKKRKEEIDHIKVQKEKFVKIQLIKS